MTRHQSEFREAIDAYLNTRERLSRALSEILKPTTTGYLWAEEHWSVRNIFEDSNRLVLLLKPPERAYEWRAVTIEKLSAIQMAVGCESISATWGIDNETLYRCSWPMPTVPL